MAGAALTAPQVSIVLVAVETGAVIVLRDNIRTKAQAPEQTVATAVPPVKYPLEVLAIAILVLSVK